MDIRDSLNCSKKCRETADKLLKENELLKENLKELENEIERIYHIMISLKSITSEEIENIEDIEEL